MAHQQHQNSPDNIGFRSVELLKNQRLGIGSYGSVCKAQCDDLLCAAKILHPTPTVHVQQQMAHQRGGYRLPIRRFEQEIEVMKTVSHPNIVQFLGIQTDPETGHPVLLVELMDDSLTHFLESAQSSIPYHIQINFCHDITRAIAYLHSNGITHRDLSSNNVLLCGTVKAKVTDFVVGDINPQASRLFYGKYPSIEAYMPPEAVKEPPVYTAKIDCFSIGVLIIQILTRKWPKPGDRLKVVPTIDPQFPCGTVSKSVSEIERRQNHISEVDPNNRLRAIALNCLKDSEVDRPSSHELCQQVTALKESPQYNKSERSAQERPEQGARNTTDRDEQIRDLQQQVRDKNDELHQLRQQHAQEVQGHQNYLQQKDNIIREKEQTIMVSQYENNQLRMQLSEKDRQERQAQHDTQQLLSSQQAPAQFQTRNQYLEQLQQNQTVVQAKPQPIPRPRAPVPAPAQRSAGSIRLSFKDGKNAPTAMIRISNAVVDDDMVYLANGSTREIYAYNSTSKEWSTLPESPTEYFSLAVVKHLLTIIGGQSPHDFKHTNKLVSFTGEGTITGSKRWKKVYPNMPTKRSYTSALCSGQMLVVAGGQKTDFVIPVPLRMVEVMDTANQQWSSAAELPGPMFHASMTIYNDQIYMLGGYDKEYNDGAIRSVYTCSLTDLIHSRSLGARLARKLAIAGRSKSKVWDDMAHIPCVLSTCVTFQGHLLAVGGRDTQYGEAQSVVHMYNPTTDTWAVVGNMKNPRHHCFAAALPSNELMVIAGYNDSVEIGTLV